MKSYDVTIQMKAIEQYFPVVLLITLGVTPGFCRVSRFIALQVQSY